MIVCQNFLICQVLPSYLDLVIEDPIPGRVTSSRIIGVCRGAHNRDDDGPLCQVICERRLVESSLEEAQLPSRKVIKCGRRNVAVEGCTGARWRCRTTVSSMSVVVDHLALKLWAFASIVICSKCSDARCPTPVSNLITYRRAAVRGGN